MEHYTLSLTKDEVLALSFSINHTLLRCSYINQDNPACFISEEILLNEVRNKLPQLCNPYQVLGKDENTFDVYNESKDLL